MDTNDLENNHVENYQQFKDNYNKIVDDCRHLRDGAGFTQSFMANWLNVGRWRIIEFESKKKIDLEMLFNYSDKLSIDIFLNHKIN
jgi:DNA-binding XRE family transcriptional regulator